MGEINWNMYDDIVKNCKKLGMEKNKQYGTESLKIFNGLGIVTRMNDKIARINNMINKPLNPDENFDESIDDTIMDLINYTIYLKLYRMGGIQ